MPHTMEHQKKIMKMLSKSDLEKIARLIVTHSGSNNPMTGAGFLSTLRKIGSKIGSVVNKPLVNSVGSALLKSKVLPFVTKLIKAKLSGGALKLAGNGRVQPKRRAAGKTLTMI